MLTFSKVETEEDLEEIYRLRYQIYCLERKYEPEGKFPDNREIDEYDVYSIHFIARKHSKAVGTVRLILNNQLGFPAEKYCKSNISDHGLKKEQTVEISRFAVSNTIVNALNCDRREIIIGLFREIYQESKKLGINYFCAAMDKGLQRFLSRYGIVFSRVGQMVNYHGMRSLHISWMSKIEQGILTKNSDLFRFITSPVTLNIHQLIRQLEHV